MNRRAISTALAIAVVPASGISHAAAAAGSAPAAGTSSGATPGMSSPATGASTGPSAIGTIGSGSDNSAIGSVGSEAKSRDKDRAGCNPRLADARGCESPAESESSRGGAATK